MSRRHIDHPDTPNIGVSGMYVAYIAFYSVGAGCHF
nr:MAG TPA: hypothetical protein [Caudoviricetes sp.]DAO99393.1 MAG TPA: hypothetical protein [Caudoviricetes sp.]DAR82033.1 MAG TPA: hypothetical protein [Caudoviricetes sp.]